MSGENYNTAAFCPSKESRYQFNSRMVGSQGRFRRFGEETNYLVPSGIRTTDRRARSIWLSQRILFVNYGRKGQLAWSWRRRKEIIKQLCRKLCGKVWSGFIWYKKKFSGNFLWTRVKYTERITRLSELHTFSEDLMFAVSYFVTSRLKMDVSRPQKPELIQVSCLSTTTGVFPLISVSTQNMYAMAALTATTYHTIRGVWTTDDIAPAFKRQTNYSARK
jgi:hypothetical protein